MNQKYWHCQDILHPPPLPPTPNPGTLVESMWSNPHPLALYWQCQYFHLICYPYHTTIISTCRADKYIFSNIVSTLVHYPHHQGNNLVLVGSHWMTLKVCLSGASHRGDQEATVSRQDPQLEHPFTHILHFDITSSQPSACQKIR